MLRCDQFLPFKQAREVVRKLKLTSQKEWEEWRKSGERPNNIPSSPQRTYRDAGWISVPDWLGYEGQRSEPNLPPGAKQRSAGRKRTRDATEKDDGAAASASGDDDGGEQKEYSVCLSLLDEVAVVRDTPIACGFSLVAVYAPQAEISDLSICSHFSMRLFLLYHYSTNRRQP